MCYGSQQALLHGHRTQTSPAPPCASDDPEPEAVMPPGSCDVDGVSGLRFNEIHPDVYTDGG